jgi:hypothetical protein
MSNGYAVAAVTAVLKYLVENGMAAYKVADTTGSVKVSAVPPDRVSLPASGDPNQINLFLHQVTPNIGWRNVGLPVRDARGDRVGNPPLALDLHYFVTVYGSNNYYGEILLGHVMKLLHETAVLSRDYIRAALSPNRVDQLGNRRPARAIEDHAR